MKVHNSRKSKTTPIPDSGGLGLLASLFKKLIRIRTRTPATGDHEVVRWTASTNTNALSPPSSSSPSSSSSSSFCSTTSSGTAFNASGGEEGKRKGARFLKNSETEYADNNGGRIEFKDLQENDAPTNKSQGEEDEENKELNSPVSILAPPFEDDDYIFSGAKRRLLLNLQGFEKSGEPESTKLEEIIVAKEDFSTTTHTFELNVVEDLFLDVPCESSLIEGPGMKRLICDMISEEKRLNCRPASGNLELNQLIVKRVCKRLELWREVKGHTIDMMIDMDLQKKSDSWKKQEDDDEISQAAAEVELSIHSWLIEELLDECIATLD